ncbi:MAG TPA: fibronectin type III domain-containing protein [Terriglobia bacterium]|nr:fibronectin type III domain-containing protein [Terriglobia bacterium]
MTTTIQNVIQKIKAKLNFHGVSDTDVLNAGNTAYNGLLNNPAFPNTPVPLSTFRQDLDSFSALIVDAEDGGKKSISAKKKQRAEVIRVYTLLGHYVEAMCNNDPAAFHTSGFTAVVKTKTAPQPLAPAKFTSIDRGPNSGQAVVKVENQKGVLAFDVHYAQEGAGGLGPWTLMTLTSSKKVTISGLTPAGTYQFQVRALGKLGYTDWSTSMTFISA